MTTHDDKAQVPPGFERMQRGGPFIAALGPLYCRRTPATGGITIAMHATAAHTNMRGIVHGGMLATLADAALGLGLTLACEGRHSFLTVNLSTDFIDAARPGDWIEAHVHIGRTGLRVAFADCHLEVKGKRILRASGVFAVMKPLTPQQLASGYGD